MVSERIQAIRERLNRREQKVRADRQARSRRIDRGEPEGARETASVKVRQAKEETNQTAEEARELAADAKTLVATELGISTDEAESAIEQGASLLEGASDQLGALDGDGDGDTDLLTALDQSGTGDDAGNGGTGGQARAEAVGPMDGGEDTGGQLFDPYAADPDASEPIYDPFEDRT